jgi:hypothetical protein
MVYGERLMCMGFWERCSMSYAQLAFINKARNGKMTHLKTTVIIDVLLSSVFIFPYIIYITSFQEHNFRHNGVWGKV